MAWLKDVRFALFTKHLLYRDLYHQFTGNGKKKEKLFSEKLLQENSNSNTISDKKMNQHKNYTSGHFIRHKWTVCVYQDLSGITHHKFMLFLLSLITCVTGVFLLLVCLRKPKISALPRSSVLIVDIVHLFV